MPASQAGGLFRKDTGKEVDFDILQHAPPGYDHTRLLVHRFTDQPS